MASGSSGGGSKSQEQQAGPSTSSVEFEDRRSIGSAEEEEDPDSLDLTLHNPTRDALAEGIVSLLSPTIKTLDEGVLATQRSQEELSEQISLLTEQLQLIASEQNCPIDLNGYVTRLGDIKGKINVISSVLHNAQERLTKVHEQATKESARRKPLIESAPVTSRGSLVPSSSTEDEAAGPPGRTTSTDKEPSVPFKDPLSELSSSPS